MRLKAVCLRRFMQFIDQVLDVDPYATVIVGRNDTGKTNILRWFFVQHVKEGVIHGRARPLIAGYRGDPVAFDLKWQVEEHDPDVYPLEEAFGRRKIRDIILRFRCQSPTGRDYSAVLDGHEFDLYEDTPGTRGRPALRQPFDRRRLFPEPYYLGAKPDLRMTFEARFYDAAEPDRVIFHPDLVPTEEILLRVAGLYAQTRSLQGRGVDEPWPDPQYKSTLTIDDIEQKLAAVSTRISELLGRWWNDPADLTFNVHLGGARDGKEYCHKLNSYGLQCELRDATGTDYYGTGLLWFVRLLIEWLWIQEQRKQLVVLIDEPATALHPRAQRALARVLSLLSEQHQIMYSTHSPFVIDWNFPQRVRLLERDPQTKRTFIRNKPFAPGPLQGAWDPLRETIGVSLGDLAVIDRKNVLVEGITDQFLIANVSVALDRRGCPHLDLGDCSITPFSDEAMLRRLIRRAKESGRQVVVVCDADKHGDRYVKECVSQGVPVRTVAQFVTGLPADQDASIEDVLGLESYLEAVNHAYAEFDWFAPLVLDPAQRAGRSLGRFVRDAFEERFPERHFDKYLVTLKLVELIQRGDDAAIIIRLAPVVQWAVTELGSARG
jgi:hypothetical protein